MTDNSETIQRIGQKLQIIIRRIDQLRRENDKLRRDLAQLQSENQAMKAQVNQMEEQAAILKTAQAETPNDASRKDFEKRINQYIRDIDKIIAHLQSWYFIGAAHIKFSILYLATLWTNWFP